MNRTFIKDLPEASKMTPWFADALEGFLPAWLESLVPYYKEGKEKGCDLFLFENFVSMGPCEQYEKEGVGYYLQTSKTGIKKLCFNCSFRYVKCNWYECFQEAHPEFDQTEFSHPSNLLVMYSYLKRTYNVKPSCDVVARRCEDYFKVITEDPDVIFSFGYTSMICFSSDAKEYVDHHNKFF